MAAIAFESRGRGIGSWIIPLFVVLGSACARAPEPEPEFGEPLAGLAPSELERFEAGRALFDRVFTPEEGLGPLFNENQCSACHTDPASGGTGEQSVFRFSRFESGGCDLLLEAGGDNVQQLATPLLRAAGVSRRPDPEGASERGFVRVPFLFGLGLVEAIPEASILALADPDDADGDGISGRPGRDAAGRVGRFGRKSEHATLESFSAGAALLEMGLTSPLHPEEVRLGSEAFGPDIDPSPDPELEGGEVTLIVDFVRFLAPPPRRIPADAESRAEIERGEGLFAELGCAGCHVPEMRTGRANVRALDRRPVRLYSDLLLHDMGPELSGFCGIGASPAEWRTEPLMGLSARERFLHDGRALDLFDAVLAHGGEAAKSKEAFRALDRVTQESLLRFLRSL